MLAKCRASARRVFELPCEVSAHSEPSRFRATRTVQTRSLAVVSAGYARIVGLEVKVGQSTSTDIAVENSAVLWGDMRGTFGKWVIDTVFVGRGRRRVLASAEAGGEGKVGVGVIGASAATHSDQAVVDELEWTDDQAYGFSFRKAVEEEPLDVRVDMPSAVVEGSEIQYIDSAGKAEVLWPSDEEPEPRVTPSAPAVLPSTRDLWSRTTGG